MELVEGPTLADRIAQGALRLDEALPLARQIAEALEAAHEPAIIHRALKPANIKLRPDGTVKVLDFGLAEARAPAHSPYMSPEQAKGHAADKRSDIWAFGCVMYEMLSG
jgi:serine/threonine protein kinase